MLGSGAVFLEGTVVNVALPAIARALSLGIDGAQWVLNGYLLTLSALMLVGGALGDIYGRRIVFVLGLVMFAVFSLACALAPNLALLVAARALQGAAGALLVPSSLALLETVFVREDRGAAIGQWAGWSAISTSVGPFVGGWLVDALSWRWVFVSIIPFALGAAWLAWRHVPADKRGKESGIDYPGATLITLGLAGVTFALISGPKLGISDPLILISAIGGTLLLVAFIVVERNADNPLLPLQLFDSRQFSGANLETLVVYAALNGMFFMVMLQLQNVVGYSALAAGAATLPINFIMLVLSPIAGRVSRRIGPRLPMTVGPIVAAFGLILFARIDADASYVRDMLPALVVFGIGLSVVVAPLTAAVLEAVPDSVTSVASAVNNAVARIAGLLAIASLPLLAGIGGTSLTSSDVLSAGYRRTMLICAGLCAFGGLIAFLMIRAPHKRSNS
ncbi:MAG TPA: DHA2 family efflux MFS transporter permease subunit [Gemmatimonadaceae bacterium]|nr:DHA2 family efflux MFS transporter permease subunit [Gemmatimonadaceae bacterium]